jgi:type I restriction enzyme S subunit
MIYIVPKDWCLKKLGECIVDNPEYGANSPAIDYTEQLPRYLRITDISESGALLNGDKKSIPEEIAKDYLLKKGDMVFARSGATVGKTYLHKDDKLKIAYAGYLIKFNTSRDILLPKYLFYFTKSNFYKIWIQTVLRQGAQPNINAQEYCSLKLPIPPIPEQQKIAEILSSWDEAIEKLERLIELKNNKFQYLRKKILKSQEVELIELGSLFEIRIGGTPSRKTQEYWDELKLTNNKWLSIRDMDRKYLYDSKEHLSDLGVRKSNVKLIKKNTLVLSFKLSLGRVGILKNDFYTNEAIAALVPSIENLDQEFYYYILQTINYDQYVDVAAKGKTLNKQKLQEDVLVPYCNYNSQKQIGQLLNTIDSEIKQLISLKTYFQQQKQGLMQKLLTGKVRVKV